MNRILDIAPLRSFVAVADCGGFQRAATSLHISQAAVSQHVRRLEAAIGRPLVERRGRGSRFTADGETLLTQARRILALHDETLRGFGLETEEVLVIGSTEHAAAHLLPPLAASLSRSLPHCRVRFRIDNGTPLREALAAGRVDVALLIGPAEGPRALPVGSLSLGWFAAPGWRRPPAGRPVPLVAFDHPCALRTRALETLAAHGIPAVVGAEAVQLAGVQAAVGAGLGIALMATIGPPPEGLVPCPDLPPAAPLPLGVWARQGLRPGTVTTVADALIRVLAGGAETSASVRNLELAKGA